MINLTFTIFGAFATEKDGEINSIDDIDYYKIFDNNNRIKISYDLKNGDYTIIEELKEQWNLETDDIKVELAGNTPLPIGIFVRRNLYEIGLKYGEGLFNNYEEFLEKMNLWSSELTKMNMKQSAGERDKLIIQTVSALDDLDESLNLFSERFREWYSLYFPEMDNLIKKHELYVSTAYEYTERENYTRTRLKKSMPSNLARTLSTVSKQSMGADLSETDIMTIKMFAGQIKSMYEFREELINYLNELMEEIAPSLTKVAGASLGARLISLTGGIDRLSKLPASAIQVMGAEKALFAHLRERALPPKHGVIFQHSLLQGAPWWVAGKVARAIANKLAIAVRADVYGNYIGDMLLEDLTKKVESIKERNPEAKKRRRKPVDRRDDRGRGDKRDDRGRGDKRDDRRGGDRRGKDDKGRGDRKGRDKKDRGDKREDRRGGERKRTDKREDRRGKGSKESKPKKEYKEKTKNTSEKKDKKDKKVKTERKIIGKTSSKY
ncbi:hypothetical protein [Methanococcus aeolicus]|uniref:Pre-mRNA processing ribonucleoprotein, binding region n=1 Tax=Methanococcus aeolicus (strain ATCC BAA-1280 / DSM 17508 / OCM 812 / Nankai-3) TaxID=419665 RepID=A6UV21_META3|nr:hypothetical protein [Methanococcus aeolicus]ABR56343.1 Pre-mRNA processing ribonucleoprotein, binding region [Methanococcus aeolicus Nankai-3]UXM84346.1 Pre-mRNA processing ribonucleoprotein [Methanococcus aeolicus]